MQTAPATTRRSAAAAAAVSTTAGRAARCAAVRWQSATCSPNGLQAIYSAVAKRSVAAGLSARQWQWQAAHWKGHKRCCKLAMHEAVALGAKLSKECDALQDRNDWPTLLPPQVQLYHLAQMIGLPQERVACHSLCNVHDGLGDYRTSLRYAEREEVLARRLDDKYLIFGALHAQMLAHRHMKHAAESVELAERIVAHMDKHASAFSAANVHKAKRDLACIFNQFEHFERAREMNSTIPGSQRSREEEGADLLNLGNTLAQRGDLKGARRAFEQSLGAHPQAVTFKALADVAWSESDAYGRTTMLQAAFRLATDPKHHLKTHLQHKVLVLYAYHNDLSMQGKHDEASDVRRKLSPLLEAQSCTGAFPNQCVVCHEDLDAQAGCWVLQVCKHLMHSECLRQTVRVQWPKPSCPVGRCQLSASDLMRLGVLDRDGVTLLR